MLLRSTPLVFVGDAPLLLEPRSHVLRSHLARRPQLSSSARWQRDATRSLRVRASASGDDDFEKRVAARGGKGGKKEDNKQAPAEGSKQEGDKADKKKRKYDFSGEKLHWEGQPHRGDLAFNVALAATVLWIPLTIAAVARAFSVRYRFTNRRLSVITDAPWKKEQLDVAYQEVKDAVTVSRGLGAWGDMVVTLRNNDKVELRSLPEFKELRDYILKRAEALKASDQGSNREKTGAAKGGGKGFA